MLAALEELVETLVLGDDAYHNPIMQPVLVDKHGLAFLVPPRKDSAQTWPESLRQLVSRLRRNIETALSILATVFDIEHPNLRSLLGLIARLSTRLLAYNLCFVMDKYLSQLLHNPELAFKSEQ